jgi:hypothetical protein
MKIIIVSCLFLALAGVASAQGASVFVKGADPECWTDVKDYIHRSARDVDDELASQQIIRAGHFSTMAGDLFFQIQVANEKNKKGEEGCHIYVDIVGGASLVQPGQALDSLRSQRCQRLANTLAAQVESMKKARDKDTKAKKTS